MNYLTENQILAYDDLMHKLDEILRAKETVIQSIKDTEQKLTDLAVILKNVKVYQETKIEYERYFKNKNSDLYRKYESSIRLHEAARKKLAEKGIRKLPDIDFMQKRYTELSKEKDGLYQKYDKVKKEIKEIKIIKQNVDSMLKLQKNMEKERQHEL